MAATAGRNTYVAIGTSGSETDVSAYMNAADLELLVDEIESTTFGDTNHEFIPGLKDTSASFSGDWDATLDGILWALYGVAGKSLIVGPGGNGSGAVKYTIPGFLSGMPISSAVDGKVEVAPTFRPSGTVTRGTFA